MHKITKADRMLVKALIERDIERNKVKVVNFTETYIEHLQGEVKQINGKFGGKYRDSLMAYIEKYLNSMRPGERTCPTTMRRRA